MAPTVPGKRPTARQKALARLADPTLPRKTHREDNHVTDSFIDSKRDKRLIKHSSFVSKITKPSSAASKNAKKRQAKKAKTQLSTTLESLGDVLDDIEDEMEEDGAMDSEQRLQGKVRHKSIKSRPGALKRKEKVVKGEMSRFGHNLAQLATVTSAATTATISRNPAQVEKEVKEQAQMETETTTAQEAATSNRWAALRGFISSTMEQNPAFLGK
ncbi:ribosome biogenesis protein SLX9-domain-containing protein [Triangularia verruculosa]|uniref:Ribosome biogenesis protein SLX9 n=1 Tax=Triangularia verruculosa TaxID=2587418 RepID=A0AAN6XE92_9PEZI|nr:ribosome biogenesis protein SLX9-domain-containing protein [Triangularia verruculosa]